MSHYQEDFHGTEIKFSFSNFILLYGPFALRYKTHWNAEQQIWLPFKYLYVFL